MPEVIAICHPEGGSPGVFEEAARESGASIREWHPAQEPEPPIDPGEAAGVLVLGGDQNVDEQHLYPYLTREIEFLKEWTAAGRPVFGVCLGAQLLAEATGGAVVRAPEREFGWLGVEVLPAGMDDPVTGFGDRRLTAQGARCGRDGGGHGRIGGVGWLLGHVRRPAGTRKPPS